MQPGASALPEFDAVRDQAVASPMRGSWHVAVPVFFFELGFDLFENRSVVDYLALRRGPSADLAAEWAAFEIGIGNVCFH